MAKGDHWLKSRVISDGQIEHIRKELRHIRQNSIQCPDTEASFKAIEDILKDVQGV